MDIESAGIILILRVFVLYASFYKKITALLLWADEVNSSLMQVIVTAKREGVDTIKVSRDNKHSVDVVAIELVMANFFVNL